MDNDDASTWDLSDHRVTRERLLRTAGVLALGASMPGLVTACGGDDEEPRPDIDRIVAEHLPEHLGAGGASLWQSRVTNERYRARLVERASAFKTSGGPVPLEVDQERAIDAGAIWGNTLVLTAPVKASSTLELVDFVRSETGDEFQTASAVFGYHRLLDVVSSRTYGKPLLAHFDNAIVIPNVSVPDVPTEQPEVQPEIVVSMPPRIYFVSPSKITAIEIPAAPGDTLEQALAPRDQRLTSFLDSLTGLDAADEIVYTQIEETDTAVELTPDALIDQRDVAYTEATLVGPSERTPTETSTSAEPVTAAPTVPQDPRAQSAGRYQTTRQGLTIIGDEIVVYGDPAGPGGGIAYGPPYFMPLPYHSCSSMPSTAVCQTCTSNLQVALLGAVGVGLTACLKFGVPAAAAACGPFFWICGPAAAVACLAVAGAAAYLINYLFGEANAACTIAF